MSTPFIDKKHGEHKSIIWSIFITLLVLSMPLFFFKEIEPVIKENVWLAFVSPVLVLSSLFMCFIIVKKHDDPNYDKFRLLNFLIAIASSAILLYFLSNYRVDHEKAEVKTNQIK